ncbi:Hint domain-containing protein [Archangium sp.]|uniref:Hint domain-containing protein n=1 Tax=Archangium sp. TaxID=1872627 RepID=UPI00286C896E|nr:Hint domain-containing protein [Archangium sp.]
MRFKSITTVAAPGCNVVHPQDNAPTRRDGIVTICLDRNHGDCDYPLVGYREVQIPLQGSFTFPFPVTSINNTASTYAKLVEESGGPREMAFGTFFSELRINPDNPRQVWWSVPQHRGIFAGVLFRPYEDVDLFLGIDVTMNRGGRPVQSSVTLASTPGGTSKFVCMPKIQISYSCLAKGTQVKLAGGKSAAIETIAKGSEVLTDGSGVALGVADTSVGIERIPMVRLKDAAGHNLLLTTSHPVMTPDRGVVWAEELAVGDKVMTETGVSTLVKASRETYNGTVHNLKLANSASTRGSTMYANGFLVGDLAMQKTYEFKNNPKPGADVLAKLPTQWHNDYQSSLKQGTLAARR